MRKYSDPISQLIHNTVRIVCFDTKGTQSSGTGYIYFFCEDEESSFPCIVTNKHVIRDAKRGSFNLTLQNEDGSVDLGNHESIELDNLLDYCIYHPTLSVDLVAIPIAPILHKGKNEGRNYHFIPLGKKTIADEKLLASLSPMEEIVMIGYPEGIWDEYNNLPIIRKGITATHPRINLNGKPEFLIDAACFPGSSGSPVFLANIGSYIDNHGNVTIGSRIALLGTLYSGPQSNVIGEIKVVNIPTDTKQVSLVKTQINLGYVIQANELLTLEEAVRNKLTQSHSPQQINRNSLCSCGSGRRNKNCCGAIKN